MDYLIGQKVITLDNEQGFISCVYDCGSFEVDILDDNRIDTVTIGYDVDDSVKVSPDQTPQLNDVTPLGVVMGIHALRAGIISVHTCNSLDYAGLWLSDERVAYLNGYGEVYLPHRCWVDCSSEHFDDVLTVLDVQEATDKLVNAPIRHYEIPEQCSISVLFGDNGTERWRASVLGSEITAVDTPKGKVKSLGAFRDVCNQIGVTDATLHSEYGIKGF